MQSFVTIVLVLITFVHGTKSECELSLSKLNKLRIKYFNAKGFCPCEPKNCYTRNRDYFGEDTAGVIDVSQQDILVNGDCTTETTKSVAGLQSIKTRYHSRKQVDECFYIIVLNVFFVLFNKVCYDTSLNR